MNGVWAQAHDPAATIWTRGELLGDIDGLRPALAQSDITVDLSDTEAAFGNPTGGRRHGASYAGLTMMALTYGGEKPAACGCTFHISAQQIRGRGLSDAIGNINTVTGIEAPAQTSLFELWYDQSFAGGRADVRVGRQAADQEFMVSDYAGSLINASFGWPSLPAADLPAGGSAYPFATTGVRFALRPSRAVTVHAGAYDSNNEAAGFSLRGGAFAIAELGVRLDQGVKRGWLPTALKFGAWYDSNPFADQHYDSDDVSLADPSANRTPLEHRGNFSVYAIVDQTIFRDKVSRAGVFGRVMVAPGDRNPIAVFADGGLAVRGPLPGRPNDSFSLGAGYARVSDRLHALLADEARYSGGASPTAQAETILEITYRYQIVPWATIQPDFQYVFNPGGGAPDPDDKARTIGDTAIFGVIMQTGF
ncbi:MAG: carbohydrate porin [Sulfobacillus sp.]